MKNRTLLNVLSNILLQFVMIASTLVIPRIILSAFGSETNGLISSLEQLLGYISLAEGGLGGVVAANLYRPLVRGDKKRIASVVKTTQSFYRRLSLFFAGYVAVVAVGYPLVVGSPFSFAYIASLTLILAVRFFAQYNFSLSNRLLLQANKQVYLVSFAQTISTLVTMVAFFIVSRICPNIHLLELTSVVAFLIQPLAFGYFARKYHNLDLKAAKPDKKLLASRWDGFSINTAAFIHNNTDIAVLTLLTSLSEVSVYAVHAIVTLGLRKILQAVSSGIAPTIGHVYAKGDKLELDQKFSLYELTTFILTFFLFAVGGLLIVPFVQFYTSGIHDANYYQPVFALLLILAEFIYCIREPYTSLAYSADRFKDIRKHAYIEAGLNIVLSLALVSWLGLVGVAIGTLVAMFYRTGYQILYLKFHILHRPLKIFFQKFAIFSAASAIGVALCLFFLPITEYTLSSLVIHGVIYAGIIGGLYAAATAVFYRKEMSLLLTKSRKKGKI